MNITQLLLTVLLTEQRIRKSIQYTTSEVFCLTALSIISLLVFLDLMQMVVSLQLLIHKGEEGPQSQPVQRLSPNNVQGYQALLVNQRS